MTVDLDEDLGDPRRAIVAVIFVAVIFGSAVSIALLRSVDRDQQAEHGA